MQLKSSNVSIKKIVMNAIAFMYDGIVMFVVGAVLFDMDVTITVDIDEDDNEPAKMFIDRRFDSVIDCSSAAKASIRNRMNNITSILVEDKWDR